MRARVTHTLTYRYSAPVLLGPHRFCLKPRGHGFQRLLDFQLVVTPEPGRLYSLVAASGDEISRARFNGPAAWWKQTRHHCCRFALRSMNRRCPTQWAI